MTNQEKAEERYPADGEELSAVKRVAYLAGLEEDKWVRVEDGLPEPYQAVLFTNMHTLYVGCKMGRSFMTEQYKMRKSKQQTMIAVDGVTHWMPVPEPPKQVK